MVRFSQQCTSRSGGFFVAAISCWFTRACGVGSKRGERVTDPKIEIRKRTPSATNLTFKKESPGGRTIEHLRIQAATQSLATAEAGQQQQLSRTAKLTVGFFSAPSRIPQSPPPPPRFLVPVTKKPLRETAVVTDSRCYCPLRHGEIGRSNREMEIENTSFVCSSLIMTNGGDARTKEYSAGKGNTLIRTSYLAACLKVA